MITAPDVMRIIDDETIREGKIHAISFQRIVERLEVLEKTAEFILLESILSVLVKQGKLKKINGNPPLFIKL